MYVTRKVAIQKPKNIEPESPVNNLFCLEKLCIRKIIQVAKGYKNQGANVIDLGCMPDTKFDHLEDTIKALKCDGFKASVDSANSEELQTPQKDKSISFTLLFSKM